MSGNLVCRACLATDIKLFNIQHNQLKEFYETIVGLQMSGNNYPYVFCVYCSALLQKFELFKQQCKTSLNLLQYSLNRNALMNENYNLFNERKPSHLQIFTVARENYEYVPSNDNYQTNDEPGNYDNNGVEETDLNYYSENEPLSNIATDNKRKTKSKKKKSGDGVNIKREKEEDCNFEEYKDLDDVMNRFENEQEKFDKINMRLLILSKEEQLKEVKNRVFSLNYLKSFYKCDKCFKGFQTENTFKNHMMGHDDKMGDYVCEICQYRLSDPKKLRFHILMTHERKYVCKQCGFSAKHINRAKEHFKWHAGHTYNCNICGASFMKSTSYLTHRRMIHPTNKYRCDLCGECFISKIGLKLHKNKVHTRYKSREALKLVCANCNVKFKTFEALKRHNNENDVCNPNNFPCVTCGEDFSAQSSLEDHLKFHEDTAIKCPECNKLLRNEKTYTLHYERIHLGVKGAHKMAQMEGNIICEICGRKCCTKATYITHKRTHTGEKPYQCTECPKKFSVQQRLQIHKRTHSGERPFTCVMCPKAFKHKAALNRHNRVHTGEKPYPCPHCHKCFSQSNSMKLHIKTVHLKMPQPYRRRDRMGHVQ